MNNGRVTEAEINAILSGGRDEIDRYLVTCAIQTKKIMDDLPESIAEAVADAVASCRAESAERRDMVDELWEARTQARGVYRFWTVMGKVLAAACALAGLVATFIALLPH